MTRVSSFSVPRLVREPETYIKLGCSDFPVLDVAVTPSQGEQFDCFPKSLLHSIVTGRWGGYTSLEACLHRHRMPISFCARALLQSWGSSTKDDDGRIFLDLAKALRSMEQVPQCLLLEINLLW